MTQKNLTIEPNISKYIDTAINRAVDCAIERESKITSEHVEKLSLENKDHFTKLSVENRDHFTKLSMDINASNKNYYTKLLADFNAENRDHMSALKEFFHDEVKKVVELVQDRPTRSETREIAREEIAEGLKPVNIKLDFLNRERKMMREFMKN